MKTRREKQRRRVPSLLLFYFYFFHFSIIIIIISPYFFSPFDFLDRSAHAPERQLNANAWYLSLYGARAIISSISASGIVNFLCCSFFFSFVSFIFFFFSLLFILFLSFSPSSPLSLSPFLFSLYIILADNSKCLLHVLLIDRQPFKKYIYTRMYIYINERRKWVKKREILYTYISKTR